MSESRRRGQDCQPKNPGKIADLEKSLAAERLPFALLAWAKRANGTYLSGFSYDTHVHYQEISIPETDEENQPCLPAFPRSRPASRS
jgi:hypothetical protein